MEKSLCMYCGQIVRKVRWIWKSLDLWCSSLSCLVIICRPSDSPGYKPDQSRTGLKEEPRAVCLQSEGHADAQQLSGGILDWQPEESQPEGTTLDGKCICTYLCAYSNAHMIYAAGWRDSISAVRRKWWGWRWRWGATFPAASGPVRGWGNCHFQALCSHMMQEQDWMKGLKVFYLTDTWRRIYSKQTKNEFNQLIKNDETLKRTTDPGKYNWQSVLPDYTDLYEL